jgi:hypothetical protein
MIKTDQEAWVAYPKHHNWFNKLWVSEKLGYKCGPGGTAPKTSGWYVIRPTYNLSGMGVGAKKEFIKAGDLTAVRAGYFWCEWFEGTHYSATFKFVHDIKPRWDVVSCWEGNSNPVMLQQFREWYRTEPEEVPHVPWALNELSDVGIINVEFKGDKVIEVHLRDTPDPNYDHIIPTWVSDQIYGKTLTDRNGRLIKDGYRWISDYDDADGQLSDPRTGFWVK